MSDKFVIVMQAKAELISKLIKLDRNHNQNEAVSLQKDWLKVCIIYKSE